MNRTSVEAIGLVLATLNLDDVYPELRELLREVLADAKNCNCERYKLSEACYTTPQTKPLSDEEITQVFDKCYPNNGDGDVVTLVDFARAILKKASEK